MTLWHSLEWLEIHPTADWILFLAVFGLFAAGGEFSPRRASLIPKSLRWIPNGGLAALDFLILRLLAPGGSLLAANWALTHRIGFFNWIELPQGFSIVWALILLEITVYYQHRAFHALPLLWKFHRVHHADLEVDVSTAARFHPVETVLSWGIKSLVILLWGLPVEGVFLFEALWIASSLFNHSNLKIPLGLDKILRVLLVTPDLHRIHHSASMAEANSDFGFIFSVWDKLFGTYRAEPQGGQIEMKVGLEAFNDPKYLTGGSMLLMPWMDKEGRCAWDHLTKRD